MGTFQLACPQCGALIEADETLVGRKGRCEQCGSKFTVLKPNVQTFGFACPHCQATMDAEEGWVGQVAQCPSCGQDLTVQRPAVSRARPGPMPSAQETPTACDRIKGRLLVYVAASVAILVILAWAGYALFAQRAGASMAMLRSAWKEEGGIPIVLIAAMVIGTGVPVFLALWICFFCKTPQHRSARRALLGFAMVLAMNCFLFNRDFGVFPRALPERYAAYLPHIGRGSSLVLFVFFGLMMLLGECVDAIREKAKRKDRKG